MVAILEKELSESSFAKDTLVPHCQTETALSARHAKRCIRFSPNDRVFEIPHLNDLSDDEINDMWIRREDFENIRRECKALIRILHRSHQSRLKDIELRGLEHHRPREKEEVERLLDMMYDTVDRVMRFSDDTSMDTSGLLAEMCMKISESSVAKARKTALQDEENARPR
ncbi:MAG: hypothetical protein SGBAC_004190 [Bacillariaceae sp.]